MNAIGQVVIRSDGGITKARTVPYGKNVGTKL